MLQKLFCWLGLHVWDDSWEFDYEYILDGRLYKVFTQKCVACGKEDTVTLDTGVW